MPKFLFMKATKARNSRPEVFSIKGALRNFAKFIGRHLCQRFFFKNVASLILQLY